MQTVVTSSLRDAKLSVLQWQMDTTRKGREKEWNAFSLSSEVWDFTCSAEVAGLRPFGVCPIVWTTNWDKDYQYQALWQKECWPGRVLFLQSRDRKEYNKSISDARGGEDLLDITVSGGYDSVLMNRFMITQLIRFLWNTPVLLSRWTLEDLQRGGMETWLLMTQHSEAIPD